MRANRSERNEIRKAMAELDKMAAEVTKLRAKLADIENSDPANRQLIITFATVEGRNKFAHDVVLSRAQGHGVAVRATEILENASRSRRALIGTHQIENVEGV